MSEQARQQVTIAVDLKKYRIRIHRNTLALLGTPKYIQLLVSKCTYRLTGEIVAEENAAVFPLSTIQEVENMEAM